MKEGTITVLRKRKLHRLLAGVSFVAALTFSSQLMLAQESNQKVFPSPEEASAALFGAAQQADNRALLEILGPAAKDLVSSGDPVEDKKERERFVAKYEQMHRLVKERDGERILYIGAENWPNPIPLVDKNGVWYFDTEAGKEEVLARRVGRNELATIDVCYQLVDAQQDHYANVDGGERRYALKFIGDKDDSHDSLFSSGSGRQFASPHDALIAYAGIENGKVSARDPIPFNGYYLRILTAQGKSAEGGAKSYVANGKMLSGFAFVAYPAVYRSTGVMSFIVNQSGIVYQKDLGPDTDKIGVAMTEYDPDSSWERVD